MSWTFAASLLLLMNGILQPSRAWAQTDGTHSTSVVRDTAASEYFVAGDTLATRRLSFTEYTLRSFYRKGVNTESNSFLYKFVAAGPDTLKGTVLFEIKGDFYATVRNPAPSVKGQFQRGIMIVESPPDRFEREGGALSLNRHILAIEWDGNNLPPNRIWCEGPQPIVLVQGQRSRRRAAPPTCPDTLLAAARKGDVNTITNLLHAGLDPNCEFVRGWTPLAVAASAGRGGAVAALITAGATIDPESRSGLTPLMGAASNGSVEIVEMLLAKGAAPDARSFEGYTALMFAAKSGHEPIIRRLLRAGADVNATAGDDQTPLMFAVANRESAAVDLLLDAGARDPVLDICVGTIREGVFELAQNLDMDPTKTKIQLKLDDCPGPFTLDGGVALRAGLVTKEPVAESPFFATYRVKQGVKVRLITKYGDVLLAKVLPRP